MKPALSNQARVIDILNLLAVVMLTKAFEDAEERGRLEEGRRWSGKCPIHNKVLVKSDGGPAWCWPCNQPDGPDDSET